MTTSGASSPASSSCRAIASTPPTANGSPPSSPRCSTPSSTSGRCCSRSRCWCGCTSCCAPSAARSRARTPPEIERRLVEVTTSWAEELRAALIDELGEEAGVELHQRYADAFPAGYQADWAARAAVADIRRATALRHEGGLAMVLYRPLEARDGAMRCKLYSSEAPILLSDALPIFENMGARITDERPYEITPRGSPPLWLYDFGFVMDEGAAIDADEVRGRFEEAFIGVWRGAYENDSLNRLVLESGLSGREVTILRAIGRYLRQGAPTLGETARQRALTAHPDVASLLVALFRARFDPVACDGDRAEELRAKIDGAIDAVASLDDDRVLRSHLMAIMAMTRTDHYQPAADGLPKPSLAFKLDPQQLPMLPAPRPRFEIFVYAPRVEGVHLRGGRVARGGIRWSDRRDDYRTEILGLMKAQTVKNAVIVPVGAKGGFVVKQPPAGAPLRDEVIACYRIFVASLLDLTDNIVAGEVVPAPGIVRHDGDDTYLVVAADKGTAAFSDIANEISAAHGFWLGDAFASGGSAGYDHKRMGITARGAWEAVRRHFRELAIDIQTSDFTVVGVGDMSGDVFGNGMLLSRHIKLIGAFNHAHVFLDPDPDPERSHAERARLFALERSAWSDYDAQLISPGGGVFSRTAKSIPISPQVRAALEIDDEQLTPDEVIRAILRAPADLLWNGGIGTYVKGASEIARRRRRPCQRRRPRRRRGAALPRRRRGRQPRPDAARTRRVRARRRARQHRRDRQRRRRQLLRPRGQHQDPARPRRRRRRPDGQAARRAARGDDRAGRGARAARQLHADAGAQHRRQPGDGPARRARAPDPQPRALGRGRSRARVPARRGGARRARGPRPRPDLARARRAARARQDRPALAAARLRSARGSLPRRRAAPLLPLAAARALRRPAAHHRLAREIITTHLTNDFVDRLGIGTAFQLGEESGAPPADLARAYTAAREIFAMREYWDRVEALDGIADAGAQEAMLLDGRALLEHAIRWLVRTWRPLEIGRLIERYGEGAAALGRALPDALDERDAEAFHQRAERLAHSGVPPGLAARAPPWGPRRGARRRRDRGGDRAGGRGRHRDLLPGRRPALAALAARPHPRAAARQSLAGAGAGGARRRPLGAAAGAEHPDPAGAAARGEDGAPDAIERWSSAHAAELEHYLAIIAEIRAARTFDQTTLSVALREAGKLLRPA